LFTSSKSIFMKKLCAFFMVIHLLNHLQAQNVGIGTSSPKPSAVLDISSSNKGVLFPRLSIAQRLTITNPANGLHIFNTDVNSLEYFDSLTNEWKDYAIGILNIHIDSNTVLTNNGYTLSNTAGYNFCTILIDSNVTLSNLTFNSNAGNTLKVYVINNGNIIGKAGAGGKGAYKTNDPDTCGVTSILGKKGGDGDDAIDITTLSSPIILKVLNYGIIAGGGGGGGGGAAGITGTGSSGGGGGGGQGRSSVGGSKGDLYLYQPSPPSPPNTGCHLVTAGTAANGTSGSNTAPGIGGNGSSGTVFTSGSKGGNGGAFAQAGFAGSGGSNAGLGGSPGKAVKGGNSNSIINYGTGIVYGIID
jgi:hypothetical protein